MFFSNILCGRGFKKSFPSIFFVLRKHSSVALLLIFNRVSCEQSRAVSDVKMSSQSGDGSYRINIANGLLLYYNKYSFYSQKVVMTLHEKKLPFEPHDIDLAKGEQYQSWFLQINQRGEVPVLQDTGKIIPDSARIIDYLEDNFSNGDTPRLIPLDQGDAVKQKVNHFRGLIDKINGNHITIGSFLHTEFVGSPKTPFIGPVRKALLENERNQSQNLRKYAEQNPDAKEMLLKKAEQSEIRFKSLENKEDFEQLLGEVDAVLDEVEVELSKHTGDQQNWWLCSDRFTIADISLTILLERIYEVGLEGRFWTEGKRPHIDSYFKRVQERDSYKETMPTFMDLIKMIFKAQAPLFIGLGVTTTIALIVGGYFIVRRIMSK